MSLRHAFLSAASLVGALQLIAVAAHAETDSSPLKIELPSDMKVSADFAGATRIFTPENIVACLKDFDRQGPENKTQWAPGEQRDLAERVGHAGPLECEREGANSDNPAITFFRPAQVVEFVFADSTVNGGLIVGLRGDGKNVSAAFAAGEARLSSTGALMVKPFSTSDLPGTVDHGRSLTPGERADLTNILNTVADNFYPAPR